MANVLITGASGLLGKYLMHNQFHNISGTWFTNNVEPGLLQMDICNKSQVSYIISRVKPDVIIHCAAIGSVDYVENNYTESYHVNVMGTKNLVNIARDARIKFVYISSNAVFAGDAPPYNEQSERKPVNRYGSMKREAENIVMDSRDWLIIRPFIFYGWPYLNGRSNPLVMFASRLADGQPVKAVNDIYWQPTSVTDAAQVIWQLLEYKAEIFNIAPDEKMTLYDFALAIADKWHYDKKLIEPVPNSYFNLPAPRPIDTSYDLGKLKALGIKMKTVKEGLADDLSS